MCSFNPKKAWLKNYSLEKYSYKMSYSESEPDSNSLSIFAPIFPKCESDADSESDINSVFINLSICVFLPYIYTLLNKLVDDFFLSIVKAESIVMQAMQV